MPGRSESGFSYVILLIAVAVIGVGTTTAVQTGSQMSRRAAEAQLLYIGGEFQKALLSYSAGAADAGPTELTELLKDRRQPDLRRHLRRIYADPLTGSTNWGLQRSASGQITGVYSLAAGVPIKRAGFEAGNESFEEARSYRDWVFGIIRDAEPQ
jgi:type II secretory pathway pseudopilin PulG